MTPVRRMRLCTLPLTIAIAITVGGCGPSLDPAVNNEDADKLTSLMRAAATGDVATATTLFKRGADANVASSDGQITAMMVAAYHGHKNMVDLLAQHGARFQAKDEQGNGPIDWAATGGHKQLVTFFRDKGADLKPVGGDALSSFLAVGSMNLSLMKKAAAPSAPGPPK